MSAIEWALLVCIIADCALQWRTERRLAALEREHVLNTNALTRMMRSDRVIAENYQRVYTDFAEQLRVANAQGRGKGEGR